MQIHFLSARVPLTKTFTRLPSGAIDKSAYPLVKNFTSHDESVETPEDFHRVLTLHAARGHSLLKGKLHRQLNDESRAGSTTPLDFSRWSCFDLDNVKDVATVEDFIQNILPQEFHDTTYVLQYSASAGIMPDEGLRAHIFFLHEREFSPEAAKLWFTETNLTHPILSPQLSLSAAGTALRFPLDRTICQNDKLIYIAPPALGDGVEDRLSGDSRIQLVTKTRSYLDFDWRTDGTPLSIEALVQATITKLRGALGLKPKVGKTKILKSGVEVQTNPDTAIVTGEKRARGWVYLNLNGGDSWGYYYSERNPKYLYNFKGEPAVELAKFAPSYWAQVKPSLNTNSNGARPFAFRFRPADQVYNGVYDPDKDTVTDFAPTQRAALPDFFDQFDMEPPRIEDWTLEFRPSDNRRIDFDGKFCNLYERSAFIRDPGPPQKDIPPTIKRVIHHVLGEDQQCFDHFINWIATIFQLRCKTMVAWVLHGTQGTGKGVLFNHILTPLFGQDYCISRNLEYVEERYNADLERCLLFNLDEARIDDSKQASKLVNKLKSWITEPRMSIRAMRSNTYTADSYTNFIITSNAYDALAIAPDDRRFNVAVRQEKKLELSDEDLKRIDSELHLFAGYLAAYRINKQLAHTPLMNDAKRAMRDAGQDALEQMAQAIIDGNLGYFFSFLDTSNSSVVDLMAWSNYKTTLRGWLEAGDEDCIVSRAEALDVYMYLMNPSTAPGPHKFNRMMAHKNVVLSSMHWCKRRQMSARGFKTKWLGSEWEKAEWKRLLDPPKSAPLKAEGTSGTVIPMKLQ